MSPSPVKYVLAVDLGTSGCKTALVSTEGKVIAWETQAVPLYLFPNGGAQQKPDDWWQAFLSTAKRLIQHQAVPPSDIIAVCCSTQGEGTIPVDSKGNALMDAILWMDARGQKYLKTIAGGGPEVSG